MSNMWFREKRVDFDKSKMLLFKGFKQQTTSNSIIEARSVNKYKKIGKKEKSPLIIDFNLVIEKGELITIGGESGSGKSTIIKLLSGYLPVDEGNILFNNKEISKVRSNSDNSQNSRIPFIPQFFQYGEKWAKKTVYDILEDTAKNIDRKTADMEVIKILGDINLEHKRNTFCSKLSYGELQRLIIGISLLKNPYIVFMDMPLNNQDPINADRLISLFTNICKSKQIAIIAATNNIHFMKKSKKTLIISEGKIHNTEIHEEWIQAHNIEILTSDEKLIEEIHKKEEIMEHEKVLEPEQENEEPSLSYFCPLCNHELDGLPSKCPNCEAPLLWE
ncbi:MAG: energy-coupling factor ABC transporter ATP-binding protein [archaeon]|nr:energy-coupling factor ABC transporter ATP-binding protein [archaeon]